MKKLFILSVMLSSFLRISFAQNSNMRQHAPKERLKSSLADSMRLKGMGLPPDTNRTLMYNDRAATIDTMKVPVSGRKKNR